ncbi:MAG: alkaline phosphatase [Hyphomicrobiales bacterium]|nr:alkaline phosphatase [Hyphomicrobiales bacterium]
MRPKLMVFGLALAALSAAPTYATDRKDVIFYHPDGTGAAHWNAMRYLTVGPDGEINWDKLPAMALYMGHMKDALTGTSNGGATTHAYGVKVKAKSFGLDGEDEIKDAAGQKKLSIMMEAKAAGRALGLIQSGHIAEPGTAAFVASAKSRRAVDEIALQVIESGAEVIMAGGEKFLLPEGVEGRHGKGARKDRLNLVLRAKELGYTVVYTRDELAALDLAATQKLLGVFAHGNTFNDQPEEKNAAEGKPNYTPSAPTIGEMGAAALAILKRDPDGFFLVAEEEGADNMGNVNNAIGQMEALKRADDAIAVFRAHVAESPNTLLLMAADSDAGGMQVIGPDPAETDEALGEVNMRDRAGALLDGAAPTAFKPFMSAPDKAGKSWPFAISWATRADVSGAILVRAEGANSHLVKGKMDNTDIYKLMYLTLFGREAH